MNRNALEEEEERRRLTSVRADTENIFSDMFEFIGISW